MKRLIIAAALLAACPASAAELLAGPYAADIVRVIDGDTVVARVHLWLGQDLTTHVRLRGIDAPKLHGRCPGEREAAAASRDALIRLLGDGKVTLTRIADDTYGGRVDASIQLADGRDASAILLRKGFARVWPHARGRAE